MNFEFLISSFESISNLVIKNLLKIDNLKLKITNSKGVCR